MTGNKRTWYRQPLLHFLAAGALLFVFYEWRAPAEAGADENVIVVNREVLLNYMQFRANAFDEAFFNRQLDGMDTQDRQRLIENYAREEALYREALAMGLDQDDYNIKQRLVEKVSFLLETPAESIPEPGEEALRAYYEDNTNFYRRNESYTFVHVFVDDPAHSEPGRERAASLLEELRADQVDFNEAEDYGDTFPNLQYYLMRPRDFVRNNFDDAFVAALEGLETGEGIWQGPLTSPFGYHLVMLTRKQDAGTPPLDEIRARVLEDYRIETAYFSRLEAEDNLVDKYLIETRGLE